MPPISKKLCELLNDQIQNEISAAYLYLAMSSHCESINFRGAAKWLRIQWEEELGHALRILDHVNSRGNKVVLKAIPQPKVNFSSLLKLFENVFEHEREVSSSINELYGAAIEERDFATQSFLTWFVNEQVEEENNAHAIVETLKMAGDESSVLLIVDQQLGARAKPTGSETEAE